MALAEGQACLPASFAVTDAAGGAANILQGVGSFITFATGTSNGVMNTGGSFDGTIANLREVRPSATPSNFGRRVRLLGAGVAFEGVVIAALQVELATTGGSGALTECLLIQPSGNLPPYLTLLAGVEFI